MNNNAPSKGISWGMIVIIVILTLGFLGLALPSGPVIQQNARLTQAGNNARQIIVCLKAWAMENQGHYPDAYEKDVPQVSNDAFRLMIKSGIIEDERIFTAPASPFTNDNNIGETPDFKEALEAGENHWCMVKGLKENSDGNAPLVFENPVTASWPPMWNCDIAGQPKEGRAWKGGKIIVGLNDGSVMPQKLEKATGDSVGLEKDANGKDLFTRFAEAGEFLDILR